MTCAHEILEERTRIAREFHDTLEQALVAIGMQLEAVRNLLSTCPVPKEPLDILDTACSMVRHSYEEARRSVWNLRPSALERTDLASALSEMSGQVKNGAPVRIDLEVSGSPTPLPSRIEGHLLRIGQEATTNAIKHSQTKTIRLELLYAQPQFVRLSI